MLASIYRAYRRDRGWLFLSGSKNHALAILKVKRGVYKQIQICADSSRVHADWKYRNNVHLVQMKSNQSFLYALRINDISFQTNFVLIAEDSSGVKKVLSMLRPRVECAIGVIESVVWPDLLVLRVIVGLVDGAARLDVLILQGCLGFVPMTMKSFPILKEKCTLLWYKGLGCSSRRFL